MFFTHAFFRPAAMRPREPSTPHPKRPPRKANEARARRRGDWRLGPDGLRRKPAFVARRTAGSARLAYPPAGTSTCCALPAVRRAAEAGLRRRWWALLSAALQRALASTQLGGRWLSPRGRLRKESPTSPMSLLWLARPGPAFCLCVASRHVGARARFVRPSRRPFRVGGVEGSLGLIAAGRKKSVRKNKDTLAAMPRSLALSCSDGQPHAGAADRDGVALSTAERQKRAWSLARSAWSSSRPLRPLSDSLRQAGSTRGAAGRSRRLESALLVHASCCVQPLDVAASACWKGRAAYRGPLRL